MLYGTDLYIMFGVDERQDYRADVNILDTVTWRWKGSHDVPKNIWTPSAIVGLSFGLLIAVSLSTRFQLIHSPFCGEKKRSC